MIALANSLQACIGKDCYPIRFSIVDATTDRLHLEATIIRYSSDSQYADRLSDFDLAKPLRKTYQASPFVVAQIVPTGIRCDFGGYAGDATPATNLLAKTADYVVTHPNAVNASDINELADNVLYVEGHSLDRFLLGRLALRPVVSNRIGTFFDPTGRAYSDDVIHVLNAAKAVAGISCDQIIMLNQPLGAKIEWAPSGSASGIIEDPETLLLGVERLLAAGCDAVGGVSVIHGVTNEMCRLHMRGELPNPSGVIEAIITHLISKVFNIPCAHAPLPYYQSVKDKCIDNPRASAEFISTPHYFCVLKGLAKAPRLIPVQSLERPPLDAITVNSLGAIIAPATALGGIPGLAAEFHDIPLIAVKENTTILGMTQERMNVSNVILVDSYLEAAGAVLAIRNGISFDCLRRPISRARFINAEDLETPV